MKSTVLIKKHYKDNLIHIHVKINVNLDSLSANMWLPKEETKTSFRDVIKPIPEKLVGTT